jgi:hypothetical protein
MGIQHLLTLLNFGCGVPFGIYFGVDLRAWIWSTVLAVDWFFYF